MESAGNHANDKSAERSRSMSTEYAELKIIEKAKGSEKSISYYILEDEQYGIQISKATEEEKSEDNELVMHNIVKSKKEAENILRNMISNITDLTQASYIVEDLLKNQNNDKDDLKGKTLIS